MSYFTKISLSDQLIMYPSSDVFVTVHPSVGHDAASALVSAALSATENAKAAPLDSGKSHATAMGAE